MPRLTTGLAVAGVLTLLSGPVAARDKAAEPAPPATILLAEDEIDSLVTRVALYPDPLLALVLQASTLPLDVGRAAWPSPVPLVHGQDGWRFDTAAGETPSPFGPFLAEVGDHLQGKQAGDPYRGYFFRVLKKQGPHAPGGAYEYVINGHMVAGFALLAWPAAYGDTGIMSFLVANDGVVLEADLGPDTDVRTHAMVAYDPDPSWQPSTD
jgi:hypothetical protein